MDPVVLLIDSIGGEFRKVTGKEWFEGKRHGATAFIPEDGNDENYPGVLRSVYPHGVIAQKAIPGAGFWDFNGVDGELSVEFSVESVIRNPDGSSMKIEESYHVITGLHPRIKGLYLRALNSY